MAAAETRVIAERIVRAVAAPGPTTHGMTSNICSPMYELPPEVEGWVIAVLKVRPRP